MSTSSSTAASKSSPKAKKASKVKKETEKIAGDVIGAAVQADPNGKAQDVGSDVLMAKDLCVDSDLFVLGAKAPEKTAEALVQALLGAGLIDKDGNIVEWAPGMADEIKRREEQRKTREGKGDTFQEKAEKGREQLNEVITKLQPVMNTAVAARETVTKRLYQIKNDVRALVLEHVTGTVGDVKAIYDKSKGDPSSDRLPDVSAMIPDPTSMLPSLFAPIYLRFMHGVYRWRFLLLFLDYLAIATSLLLDKGKECSPERPGGIFLSPSDFVAFHSLVLFVQAVCSGVFFYRISKWKKRADAYERTAERPEEASLLQSAEYLKAVALDKKDKYDLNMEALILMDRLHASWVGWIIDVHIVFSLAWGGIGLNIARNVQCADCDNSHVIMALNWSCIEFIVNFFPMMVELILFIFGHFLMSPLTRSLLKSIAVDLDDEIGVPVCSLILQCFVFRRRITMGEAYRHQCEREVSDLEKKQNRLEKELRKHQEELDVAKARRDLACGLLQTEQGKLEKDQCKE